MLVYEIGEDWYLAPTPREAFDAMLSDCDMTEEESGLGIGDVKPLDSEAMDRLTFCLDETADGPQRSFAAQYYELASCGKLVPGLFASQNH